LDVPGGNEGTAACDWADIRDRMRYVFALFDAFHDDPVVWSAPFPADEAEQSAFGRLPERYHAATRSHHRYPDWFEVVRTRRAHPRRRASRR
jgi:hypothetical protein